MAEPVTILKCPHCGAKTPAMSQGFASSYCPGCSQSFDPRDPQPAPRQKQRFLQNARFKRG